MSLGRRRINSHDKLWRMIAAKKGQIIYHSIRLLPHEEEIAQLFAALGCTVELIPTDRSHGRKTADAIIDGLEWEFKTPRGNSTRTIERILKKAHKQSENIVIDTHHVHLPEELTLRKIRHEAQKYNKHQRIKVILKSKRIIDL